MPEVIRCPACDHSVRVPESLFGQPVRCPQCKAYFRAPTRSIEGLLGTPELIPEPVHTPPPQPSGANTPMSQSPVFVPALCLLLVGVAGTLVNGVRCVEFLNDPATTRDQVIEVMRRFAEMQKQAFDEDQFKKQFDQYLGITAAAFVTVACMNLMSVIGAIAMLRMQFRGLAIFGSVTSIFNFGSCCCLIGAPVGIYCLVKLFDPAISAMFRRQA